MLRLPKFELATPETVDQAIALLAEAGPAAMIVAGGTDLVPNMKHELFTPALVVSLQRIESLRGIETLADGGLRIGAMTTLADVAASSDVQRVAPCLAQAAGLIAGPQLRTMGTLGGNVMLDTRCQWYNQTYFWRAALGFCLKKDGTKCHVVEGGQKCVAAASNDSAPALMTLDATLAIEGPTGRRTVSIDDFWHADGIFNKRIEPAEILVEIRVPPTPAGHRGAYGKLRERGSIDFPMLGVAARLDLDDARRIQRAELVLTALAAQPRRVGRTAEILVGVEIETEAFGRAVEEVAQAARKQCHPLPNIPGDHGWRREMIAVYVRRTLKAAAGRTGPVHHV